MEGRAEEVGEGAIELEAGVGPRQVQVPRG